jgi:hypothetical protein
MPLLLSLAHHASLLFERPAEELPEQDDVVRVVCHNARSPSSEQPLLQERRDD